MNKGSKRLLITGVAGFIGFHLCKKLLELGHSVVGLDNINDYYSVSLKFDRLKELGVFSEKANAYGVFTNSEIYESFTFIKLDIQDQEELRKVFERFDFDTVCNLAAQAGISHSLKKPKAFVETNLVGFFNVLECCKSFNVRHFVFASSSSVYGLNDKVPFSEQDRTDHPISLYAATKKSNELMAHSYSHLYKLHTTGLRFFTVYGPWGRPDMAIYLFTDAIAQNKPINVFDFGKASRDFTYIDDVIESVLRVIHDDTNKRQNTGRFYQLYNVGNNKSIHLLAIINEIEKNMKKKAKISMMAGQPGDLRQTWARMDALSEDFGYTPKTSITKGIKEFIDWYKSYN
ncbi:GDP-mannose 4,6-dehydratase [Spongiivirga sp. MCCC 1A20706]|uniref:GDP-mannose 4,6-dehydratase n=1 Tax=Spongiivirga sp. MCCC 1A20706 TaxID=3160963 RepID=UPI003977594F